MRHEEDGNSVVWPLDGGAVVTVQPVGCSANVFTSAARSRQQRGLRFAFRCDVAIPRMPDPESRNLPRMRRTLARALTLPQCRLDRDFLGMYSSHSNATELSPSGPTLLLHEAWSPPWPGSFTCNAPPPAGWSSGWSPRVSRPPVYRVKKRSTRVTEVVFAWQFSRRNAEVLGPVAVLNSQPGMEMGDLCVAEPWHNGLDEDARRALQLRHLECD
jgi:hypothetical protein